MERQRIRRLLNVGFDSDVFSEYREEIDDANLLMLQKLSLAGSLIGFALLSVSLLPVAFLRLTPGYGLLTVVMGVFLLLSHTVLKRRPRGTRYVLYALFASVYVTGILLGTVMQPETSAITFIVFIVALPLFLIDRPRSIWFMTGGMTLVFILLTQHCKSASLASTDTANVLVFYVLSIITSYQSVQTKMRDIVSQRRLRTQRDTDGLTGMHNRLCCESEISAYIRSTRQPALFLILDLDNFKSVNDLCGHDCGDEVLRLTAAVMRRSFRTSDVLGRLGGDEFIVFLTHCTCTDGIRDKISRMLSDISAIRLDIPGFPKIGASAGVAHYPGDGDSFLTLYQRADQALYLAKEEGKNRCVVCDPADPAS